MQTVLRSLVLVALLLGFSSQQASMQETVPSPLDGRIIALDAGHGGGDLGAQYPANSGADGLVFEKDLNLSIAYALRDKIESTSTAQVIFTRVCESDATTSRRERISISETKCEAAAGRNCDALVSIHHNGSVDPNQDGLLVIYSTKKGQDEPLALAMHESLWANLFSSAPNYTDYGLGAGGYGMTLYGDVASIISEPYFITNDWEAANFLDGNGQPVTQELTCDNGETRIVPALSDQASTDRVQEEVDGLYEGLYSYFNGLSGGGGGDPGGGGNDNCSPGQQKQGKC